PDEEVVVVVVAISRVEALGIELRAGIGPPLGREVHRGALAIAEDGLPALGEGNVRGTTRTRRAGNRPDRLARNVVVQDFLLVAVLRVRHVGEDAELAYRGVP